MKINIAIIRCDNKLSSDIQNWLTGNQYIFKEYKKIEEIIPPEPYLIICEIEVFKKIANVVHTYSETAFLVISESDYYINNQGITYDCILLPIHKNELVFRVKNLLYYQKVKNDLRNQHEKLRTFFDKSRRKTIDLFGKHVDLKKAQKEIQEQKLILEKAIYKKKYKTIELFGKHIDLKKAKKELDEKNMKLEKVLQKNKQKTIDLFGKHIDLKKAKKEIGTQKAQIEKQNISITDSIKYASFIQSAVLPQEELIQEIIPKHFIIYMPRDIVSGDFYWMEKIDDILYIAAADCTGHGVPGAFMSMLGISLLNELVIRYRNKKANDFLDLLREKVIFSLHQTGRMDEAADGMDISFCIINTKTLELHFSGAHNPIYILRNNEIIEIKGDRMPIGFSLRINKPFTDNEFQLKKGDKIYLFSDGFADQFGGENGMKMRYKVFQQHLLDSHKMDFQKQKEYLIQKFVEWKGDYNQIDDILIIGFEI